MLYDGSLTPMVTSVLIGSATEVDGKKVRPRLPTPGLLAPLHPCLSLPA